MSTLSSILSTASTAPYAQGTHTLSNNTYSYQPIQQQTPHQTLQSTTLLLNELTQNLNVKTNGMLNPPQQLLHQIANQGKKALPALGHFLNSAVQQGQHGNLRPILAGLLATEELLEAGVSEAEQFYPLISQLDHINNPLLTIYMAGVYGEMKRPESFGWAIWKLMQDAARTAQLQQNNPFAQPWPHSLKVHEELGKVIMKQLINKMPNTQYLQTQSIRNDAKNPTGNQPMTRA